LQPCLWAWTTTKMAAITIKIRRIRMRAPSLSGAGVKYTNGRQTKRVRYGNPYDFTILSFCPQLGPVSRYWNGSGVMARPASPSNSRRDGGTVRMPQLCRMPGSNGADEQR
jgi:hypothetical protein